MGINKSYLKDKFLSTKGYKRNSPDVNNPYNVIPSNQITMKGVDFPVMGTDNMGYQQMMYPGQDYTFPGDYVTEFPMKNMGNKRFGQVGMEKSNQTRSFMSIIPNFIPGVNDILDFSDIIQGMYKGDKNQMNQGIIGLAAPGIAGKGMGEMVDYFTEKTLGKKIADKNQSKRNDILNMSSSDLQKLYTKYGPGGYDKWKAAGFPKLKEGGEISNFQEGGKKSVVLEPDYDMYKAPRQGNYLLPDINRPYYIDEAGDKRSEYRIGTNIDGRETLIPTVVGGKQLSEDEARERYYQTGLHMGMYTTPEQAEYASRLRTAKYNMLQDPARFNASMFQMGGTMSVPGVNGQVVSSGPQPLTSVKKTRGPITKNKKGDVKTMSNQQVKQVLKYSKQKPNKI
jgi:hypothetical protein